MRGLGSDVVTFFRSQMHRGYLEAVVKGLFECYETVHEWCEARFEEKEAENVRPFCRRALIEGKLREVAVPYPDIKATLRRSPASGWYHTVVLCGRAAFTQNAVGGPEEIVRPSLFRQLYAGPDRQRYLFQELEPQDPPPESVLYGILIHGQWDRTRVIPGFARIVFPKENLESYWEDFIDLFKEFPEVVRASIEGRPEHSTGIEVVAPPEPELRLEHRLVGGEP